VEAPKQNRKLLRVLGFFLAFCMTAALLFLRQPTWLFHRREFAAGNALIRRVEDFRRKNGRLPEGSTEFGTEYEDSGVFYQKTSSRDYVVWFGTSLGESEVYDSATRKWD
jgi:hypothetical protein